MVPPGARSACTGSAGRRRGTWMRRTRSWASPGCTWSRSAAQWRCRQRVCNPGSCQCFFALPEAFVFRVAAWSKDRRQVMPCHWDAASHASQQAETGSCKLDIVGWRGGLDAAAIETTCIAILIRSCRHDVWHDVSACCYEPVPPAPPHTQGCWSPPPSLHFGLGGKAWPVCFRQHSHTCRFCGTPQTPFNT